MLFPLGLSWLGEFPHSLLSEGFFFLVIFVTDNYFLLPIGQLCLIVKQQVVDKSDDLTIIKEL